MPLAIRIVLADDHPIVLQGLEQLFSRSPDFHVARCCATGDEALTAVREEHPDVLVLDLRMPGKNGLDVLRTIAQERLPCRTVLLTAAAREGEVVEAVQLGAQGVVLKDAQPDALLDCVRAVHRGDRCIDSGTIERAAASTARGLAPRMSNPQPLTPREVDIVRMVAQGLRNKAISERLAISEGTVKVHLHNIYEKLGVDGRLELVLSAQERRLI
jgi:DNA-binding NarL/FixJ family response regulator